MIFCRRSIQARIVAAIEWVGERPESYVHSLVTLQMSEAGKFAGFASQFQKDDPANMVDGASF
jgi:hypothetical protein